MKLKDLLAGIEVLVSTADPETEIPGVCYDSRKVQPGELFVAVTGYATDGHANFKSITIRQIVIN